MTKDRRPVPVSPDDTSAVIAWVKHVARQARLAWRLLLDRRVPLWTKLVPPAALAYVLFPLDLIPDVALGLGQLDDMAVLLIGVKLFIELAPPDVVREHLRELGARIEEWRVVDEDGEPPTVVEGQYQIEKPESPEAEEK